MTRSWAILQLDCWREPWASPFSKVCWVGPFLQVSPVARAILDAARELFVAEGYHNVSIRKIAEKIEYSPAAIYGYFPSKDDIFLALA